jgi:Ca2+/H+ antiporter
MPMKTKDPARRAAIWSVILTLVGYVLYVLGFRLFLSAWSTNRSIVNSISIGIDLAGFILLLPGTMIVKIFYRDISSELYLSNPAASAAVSAVFYFIVFFFFFRWRGRRVASSNSSPNSSP